MREPATRLPGVIYEVADIRAPEVDAIVGRNRPDVIVHLASIVTPGKNSNRAFEYDVDVNGTRNLLQACVAHGVRRIIVSSSGAAYGYHADNPEWLTESDPVRGNEGFAYSCHKRLVEEMLADYRKNAAPTGADHFPHRHHPGPDGAQPDHGPVREAAASSPSPAPTARSSSSTTRTSSAPSCTASIRQNAGIFNVAGDGKLTIFEIAQRLGKTCRVLPAPVLQAALWVLKKLGLTQYGPEQLDFLRYRPVLLNTRLKEVFGYTPKLTSAEVFDLYRNARQSAT